MYMILKYIFILGVCCFAHLLCSCQNTRKINILDYEVDNNFNTKQEKTVFCWEGHEESMWANHLFYRNAGDSVIRAVLSRKADTLFAFIYPSMTFRSIELDKIPRQTIASVYYHNNDSIFIFYDRVAALRREKEGDTTAWADFVLMDGNGTPIRTYRTDSVPFIYNGKHWKNVLKPINADMSERIFNNCILLNFEACYPWVTQSGYDTFNPPLAVLYDLQNGITRTMNIRPPIMLFGKKYGMWSGRFWVRKAHDGRLLIGFYCLPYIYEYNWKKERMVRIGKKGSRFFWNIDSSSMKTGKDYPLFCFNEPEWLPAYNCYTRSISIMHYPGYKPYDNILELLDKNFNHIAYVTGNDIYCTPALTYDGLNTFDKNARRPHRVHLKKKIAKVNAEKCLSTFLVKNKQIVPLTDTMTVGEYLQAFHLPEGSLILIVNLKYPCGHCMDYLFAKMDTNQREYAENSIYYLVYDPESSVLMKTYLKRHHLENAKNILQDNTLLQTVFWLDNNMADGQFYLVDYHSTDKKHILMMPLDYNNLPSTLNEWVERQKQTKLN